MAEGFSCCAWPHLWNCLSILTKDLDLVKKSARWVLKKLSTAWKQEHVDCSGCFLVDRATIGCVPGLDIDDGRVYSLLRTHETKKQSMQEVKEKKQSCPKKARFFATRSKQMVLVFVDVKSIIDAKTTSIGTKLSTLPSSRRLGS